MLKNIVCLGPVSALTGIHFGDNGGQKYLTEDNGVAVARTKVFLLKIIITFKDHSRSLNNWHFVPGSTLDGADGVSLKWKYLCCLKKPKTWH